MIKKNINNIHIQKFKSKWIAYLEKNSSDPYLFSEGMNSPPGSPTTFHNSLSGNNRKNSNANKMNVNNQ